MVLLSMTPALAGTVSAYLSKTSHHAEPENPPLNSPRAGNPISHQQIIRISRFFRDQRKSSNRSIDGVSTGAAERVNLPTRLNEMLKGCALYRPPPTAKPEPSPEYTALMAKLRAEQEERNYTSMIPKSSDPYSSITGSKRNINKEEDEDEITHASSSRQVALVVNILVSIICTFFALFFVSRSWSPPPRVALSLFGALGVGAAEVGVYWGYIRRLEEARQKERQKKEVKELVKGESWVIEGRPKGEGLKKRR